MANKPPPLPPDTCPHINNCIEYVQALVSNRDNQKISNEWFTLLETVILSELELIRNSNSELRELALFYKNKKRS